MSAPRLRCNLRQLREHKRVDLTDEIGGGSRPYSIKDAERDTGLNRGLLSMLERGIALPTDDQYARLLIVYGPECRWWVENVTVEIGSAA